MKMTGLHGKRLLKDQKIPYGKVGVGITTIYLAVWLFSIYILMTVNVKTCLNFQGEYSRFIYSLMKTTTVFHPRYISTLCLSIQMVSKVDLLELAFPAMVVVIVFDWCFVQKLGDLLNLHTVETLMYNIDIPTYNDHGNQVTQFRNEFLLPSF